MTPFDKFYLRMQKLGIKTQVELADLLSLTPNAITDAKKRGVVPASWGVVISQIYDIPLETVLEIPQPESIELKLIRECMIEMKDLRTRIEMLENSLNLKGTHSKQKGKYKG